MSFKFTFREITPEDTEILRMLKLRNAKPEEHICCEILRGDGITMKTWYSRADVALWGEDYIKANSKMKYPCDEPTCWADDHVAITGIFGIGREKSCSLCGVLGSQFMIDEWEYRYGDRAPGNIFVYQPSSPPFTVIKW